jgi:hypothetical protein
MARRPKRFSPSSTALKYFSRRHRVLDTLEVTADEYIEELMFRVAGHLYQLEK